MATALLDRVDAPAPQLPVVFRLKGAPYRLAGEAMTMAQQVFVGVRLRKAGIAGRVPIDPTDTAAQFSLARDFEEATLAAFDSGAMYEILGGILVADGTRWDKQQALATAKIIEGLTDFDEQSPLFEFAAEIVLDFFTRAAGLNGTLAKSSSFEPSDDQPRGTSDTPDASSNSDANVPTSSPPPIDSAATPSTTTGSTTPSSASSPSGM